jgi:hypothetical protein
MKRTILYYPTISIPNGEWLQRALFYFDEVASIVPHQVVYFRAMCLNERFRKQLGTRFVRVHPNKLSITNFDFLEGEGLLKYDAPEERKYEAGWFLVEERTALLYMSMLAQALADIDMQYTIPGTDQPDYEELIYGTLSPENAIPCVETHLRDVLPMPRQDVKFKDILAFKRKRKDELNLYRKRIDDLQKQLSQATERAEVNLALVQFEEAQQTELSDLVDALRGDKLATIWGSVKILIKAKNPMLWGAGAVALGLAPGIGALPISLAIAGAAVSSIVEVKSYLVDQRNKRRVTERESSFAYLYHAKAEGIL